MSKKRVVIGLLGLGGLLLAALLGVGGWLYWQLSASAPTLEGTIELSAGPGGPVTVSRDRHGVPHVFAEAEPDVFFGLGFVHADERFFQMDMIRRFVFGELSAALGDATLGADVRSRILGYPGMAAAAEARLEPEVRAVIEAYVAGVNARLERGNPSFELRLLGVEARPYRVQDVMAVLVYMAHDLTVGRSDQVLPRRLAKWMSPPQIAELLPGYPAEGPTTLRPEDLSGTATVSFDFGGAIEPVKGSNAWVVSGAHTESGKPLLANDPHLGLGLPSLWYLARLALKEEVVGATIPGAPFVLLGHNQHIAWGFTNASFDVVDLVPLDPGFEPSSVRTESIEVSGEAPVSVQVRVSEAGPVLDPRWFDFASAWDRPLAWRSTMSEPSGGPGAVLGIMKARDWDGFVEAGRSWSAPMQNMLFASVDGDIGYTAPGLVPIREADGRWSGTIPFDALPRVKNPARGWIVSANNRVAPDNYPYPLLGRYTLNRARRLEALITARESHDAASFAAMQMDVTSPLAVRLLPVLAAGQPKSEPGRALQAKLRDWDGALAANRVEGRIYAEWYRAIHPLLFGDELGPAAHLLPGDQPVLLEAVLLGKQAHWCDDVGTQAKEDCPDRVGAAFDLAAERIDLASVPSWGAVHRAAFDHQVLGRLPVLGAWFRRRAAMGGDGTTPNVGDYRLDGDFEVHHAASLRAIYDLSDLNRSTFVHAPGQAGHPFSPHFDDLLEAWATGEGFEIPLSFGPEDGRQLILR